MSLQALQNVGLSENEAKIYEVLVKCGEVPVGTLIQKCGLKRPTVYKALAILEKKGFILKRDYKKIIHVRPESPTKLALLAQEELEKVQQAKKDFDALLPALAMSYTLSTERPIVRIYEGVEGLKDIYEDILVEKKTIYALLQAADVEPELYAWLRTKFVRKRVREKVHVKAIVASSRESKAYTSKNTEEFRTTRMVDSKLFPFQHEIDIYGDKVAIIHYKKDEGLVGIVIHHPSVAMSMKAWFDLAWRNTIHGR